MTTQHSAGTTPGTGASASVGALQRVGRIKAAFDSATGLRRGMNLWPPFLLTGIHIDEVSDDFRLVRVRLRRTRLTTNYVGTQFGGSMFAMTDPFWMIMMSRNLGGTVLRWFEVDVVGSDGAVVARVRKQLSVRRAPAPSPRA